MLKSIGLFVMLINPIQLFANVSSHDEHEPFHLELEASATDYFARQESLLKHLKEHSLTKSIARFEELEQILNYGARLLNWVKLINENRSPEQRISLTSEASQNASPIDKPNRSNETIILERFAKYRGQMPEEFVTVLLGQDTIPNSTTLSDEAFIESGLKMLKIYQSASRWLMQVPYLDAYRSRKVLDIRGFYFLNQIPSLGEKLDAWDSLDSETQSQWKEWLIGECLNNRKGATTCTTELDQAISALQVRSYHEQHVVRASRMFDSFFQLQNPRLADLMWTDASQIEVTALFETPNDEQVAAWLRTNIEDEWQLNEFKLKLEFTDDRSRPHVRFVPGATPNVNYLGGDVITMDANSPLDDYNTLWTIRHEYGHVLGFPDCYVEFFDSDLNAMISYQIDTSNLMCSRRGQLQEIHVRELKEKYPHKVR